MRLSRTDRSLVAEWWFTVDKTLLAMTLGLVGVGLVLSLAASPAVAVKKGLSPLYFVERHVIFAAAGVIVLIAASLLSPRAVRRLALVVFMAAIATMILVLVSGQEINGAKRWLRLGALSLQPSEFAKPAFAVLGAWALSESQRRTDMPAMAIAVGLVAVLGVLLALQPDVGQLALVGSVWIVLFLLSGRPLIWSAAFAGCGVLGLAGAYLGLGYVRLRVDQFLAPSPRDHSQTARAMRSFVEGGFFGRGPGEGTIKTVLPDAHTDFIFAVVAEEYGIIACLILVALFAFIVLRVLIRALSESDLFVRYAATALVLLFGLQALINMAVNIGLMPAKGMTLPLISAGGSSLLAVSMTMGMVLALTRWRPDALRLKKPRLNAIPVDLEPTGSSLQG
jgi:cell division protein FtsW